MTIVISDSSGAVVFASGNCAIIVPFAYSAEASCVFVTLNPSLVNVAVPSASDNPCTEGTLIPFVPALAVSTIVVFTGMLSFASTV